MKQSPKEIDEINKMKIEQEDALKEWMKVEEEMDKEKNKILSIVKERVSEEAYEDILFHIDESEFTYNYKIVDKPIGKFQKDSENEGIEGVYVNQTTNGGYAGDEFAGTVCIKIGKKEYFKFCYSM